MKKQLSTWVSTGYDAQNANLSSALNARFNPTILDILATSTKSILTIEAADFA